MTRRSIPGILLALVLLSATPAAAQEAAMPEMERAQPRLLAVLR
jgi:hypothetical protein